MNGSTKVGIPLIDLSGWTTASLAPGTMSFQSKSGGVSVGSSRNLLIGWYHPAFQNCRFSTWVDEWNPSTPPEPPVISTTSFWRPWTSGRISYLTFMPVSDSNSGTWVTNSSIQGSL